MQKRIIYINVINEHSVLARISGLFAGRGYNIDSLSVAPIGNGELSRVTISTRGDEKILEQIIKQLHKLIPVLSVNESMELLALELLLVKFEINENIDKINSLIKTMDGKLVSINDKFIVFSIALDSKEVKNAIKAINLFLPKEIIRSGAVAIEK